MSGVIAVSDCTHTDAAWHLLRTLQDDLEIYIPKYKECEVAKVIGGALRDHAAALGHRSNAEVSRLAALVQAPDGSDGVLVEALEASQDATDLKQSFRPGRAMETSTLINRALAAARRVMARQEEVK